MGIARKGYNFFNLLFPFAGLIGSFVSIIAHEVQWDLGKQVFLGTVCISALLTSYGIIAIILAGLNYEEEEEGIKKENDEEATSEGQSILALLSVGSLFALWGCLALACRFKVMEVPAMFVSALVAVLVFLTLIVLYGREDNIEEAKLERVEKAPMVVNNDNYVENV